MSTVVTTQDRTAGRTEGGGTAAVGQRPWSVFGATLFMVVFAGYFLVPLWWLLVASSKTQGNLTAGNGLWFTSPFVLFKNIADTVSHDNFIFLRWLVNSVLYSGVGALAGTLVATMAGYCLAKYEFRGREVFFNVVLGGVLVPATALALPLFLLFSKAHAVNTYWAVFLPSIVAPFGVYLARIYAAASVPNELLEAARLDGASEFRAFFVVALRLMAPALVTIYLFQFVAIWNNFFLPLVMLQNPKLYPLTLGLYTWNGQINLAPELRLYVIVGAMLSIIPLVFAFLSLQRFWRSGLAAGGVK
jgi:multiple sugar transport system permease protein